MPSLWTPGDATPMHMHACMQFEASFAVDTGHLFYGWLDLLRFYQTCTQSIKVIKRYLFCHSLKVWTFVLCECMHMQCSTTSHPHTPTQHVLHACRSDCQVLPHYIDYLWESWGGDQQTMTGKSTCIQHPLCVIQSFSWYKINIDHAFHRVSFRLYIHVMLMQA